MSVPKRWLSKGWGPREWSPNAESVRKLQVVIIVAILETHEVQTLIQIQKC